MRFTLKVNELKNLVNFLDGVGVTDEGLLQFSPTVEFPKTVIEVDEVDEHGHIINRCLTLQGR